VDNTSRSRRSLAKSMNVLYPNQSCENRH
jgi:hypothetical protein